MAKLPQISGQKLTQAFKKDGWIEVGQKGSHLKLVKYHEPVGKSTLIIPQHKLLKKVTRARILKEGNLSLEKLIELL